MNDLSQKLDFDELAQRIHDAIHYGYPREAQRLLSDLVKVVAENPGAASKAVDLHSDAFASTAGLRSARS